VSTDHVTNKFAKMSVNNSPSPTLVETPETIIEEMACAIAEAQAALFVGRFQDLECCATRLQELCDSLKKNESDPQRRSSAMSAEAITLGPAQRVYQQNKVFAAVLRRMRRHLEALRGLLNGPSLTYQPKSFALPEPKN
jgi:hypothetical protein